MAAYSTVGYFQSRTHLPRTLVISTCCAVARQLIDLKDIAAQARATVINVLLLVWVMLAVGFWALLLVGLFA